MIISEIKSLLRDLKNYYFPNKNPFGKKVFASEDYYKSIYNKAKKEKFEIIDNLEIKNGFKIEKDWLDDLALHTQVVKKSSPINYQHGRLLYSILSKYIKESKIKNINILEIGTARGFSSICMSKSLIDTNTEGKINTIDIIPNNIKIFWNCIDDHDGKKTRYELLSKWDKERKNVNFLTGPSRFILKGLKTGRINFSFIDGMHDYQSVLREFNFISSKQIKDDLIIFDDVDIKFSGVLNFVNEEKNKKIYDIKIIKVNEERSYAIFKKK